MPFTADPHSGHLYMTVETLEGNTMANLLCIDGPIIALRLFSVNPDRVRTVLSLGEGRPLRMRYAADNDTVTVTARELASHARSRASVSRLVFAPVPEDERITEGVSSNRDLRMTVPVDDFWLTVEGRADTMIMAGSFPIVELTSETSRSPDEVDPRFYPQLLAEGMLLAHMAAEEKEAAAATVRLTFTRARSAAFRSFDLTADRDRLRAAVASLIARVLPFVRLTRERNGEGRARLQAMRFPYDSPREAQRDFLVEAFRTVRTGGRLLVSAPTGTGKTMAALYPAMKGLALGDCDKIFYLTAKTVTGRAAAAAFRELNLQAPETRCVMIHAKERTCPRRSPGGRPRCGGCPLNGTLDGVPLAQRRDEALAALLQDGRCYEEEILCRYAERYRLCPYELSLDVSEWCDLVVCDYNYVFDEKVRFRRYFGAAPLISKPVFLVDEAHNLPDRARDTYSFTLFLSRLGATETDDPELRDRLEDLAAEVRRLGGLCSMEERLSETDGEPVRVGFHLDSARPGGLIKPLEDLSERCRKLLKPGIPEDAEDRLAELLGDCRKALNVLERFDGHFRLLVERYDEEVTVRLLCLDPSGPLKRMLEPAHAAIFFSATLTPLPYFMDILGCPDGRTLDLPSPFISDNLCVAAADYISTRFQDRDGTAAAVASAIAAMTEAKCGHYIAYFPSYRFLKKVGRLLVRRLPDVKIVVQHQEMSLRDRSRFLEAFENASPGESMLGLCVLGGSFSEGIDLQGDRLIGAAVVGIGLSGLSSESQLLEEYFESTREGGREYAYVYPGINRVLQAAGRVIRSEEDRGVVLLIDDRYADPGIRRLFPDHWHHLKYVGDEDSLRAVLDRFWKE